MTKRYQPGGYQTLGDKFDVLALELRTLATSTRQQSEPAGGGLAQAYGSVRQASAALRQATQTARQALQALARPGAASRTPTRDAAGCPGGICPAGAGGAAAGTTGAVAGASSGASLSGLPAALTSGLGAALKSVIAGDFTRALQSMLSSVVRSIAGSIGRGAGGGLGGSLVSTIIGTGLSLILGKLLRKRQSVQVENTVKSEVLNFPRLLSLDYASNPASRLFGSRAVARGPAFYVEVRYRDGAEDIVAAKVASRLADMNLQQGLG